LSELISIGQVTLKNGPDRKGAQETWQSSPAIRRASGPMYVSVGLN